MKIIWLPAALRDLREIRAYIANDNPGAAERMSRRLREAVSRLADLPASGRPGRVANTRELIVPQTPYFIPYKVRADTIFILRVYHAARIWPPRK